MTSTPSVFDLPARLHAKASPALISADEQHFAALAECLESSITDLSDRLAAERLAPGGSGQQALERDMEVHRLTARIRALRRYGLDLCLGRMVTDQHADPVYIGRFGVTDNEGRQLLVDWRTPAAEPFFGATHAHPMGLASRRRYRWTRGRVTDYWDEVFTAEGLDTQGALDDQSAFIASLGTSRSPQMRDVLSTIQSDQDAIIRADARGVLVVDGGPGTGKTVVALHRAAYLMYSDARIHRGGGVLFVGPHPAYLAYVDDVLPSLGEESVQVCTLRDLVAQGATAADETDGVVAGLKASGMLLGAVEAAVRHYERAPIMGLTVETPWADVWLSADDWEEAFEAADEGTPHNEAREQVWEALHDILIDRLGEGVVPHLVRRALMQNQELADVFARAWPLLDPVGVVADLWSVPSYLRACAPWLSDDEVRLLQRGDPRAWTVEDLPYLDAARQRIGDPAAARLRRRREAARAAEREQRERVAEELIAADDSELRLMSMLRGQDAQNSLAEEDVLPRTAPELLAGPFAHVIVDEAQELTDAQWQMVLRRCPSRSLTIVGDRAQARRGFTESWEQRLSRVGCDHVTLAGLSINYRTPEEVMRAAEPVIREAIPDANVPTSVRSTGVPVRYGSAHELRELLEEWLAGGEDGTACVITTAVGERGVDVRGRIPQDARIRVLPPEHAKGLEFDLVVLLDPDAYGEGISGAVDRYVAMTRATQRLVILTTPESSSTPS